MPCSEGFKTLSAFIGFSFLPIKPIVKKTKNNESDKHSNGQNVQQAHTHSATSAQNFITISAKLLAVH